MTSSQAPPWAGPLGEIAREFRAIVAARLAVAHPGYDAPAGQRERKS
ncbi:MAG TPA: hypothetical protein VMI73_09265 [Trebonia sp.]|nr:hypothetical protein [Trebonia sp.]